MSAVARRDTEMVGGSPARIVALGCFMAVLGFFSAGMVGVLVGRLYSWVAKCPYEPNLPACNWAAFAGWGGLIGAVTLPALVVGRLVRRVPRRPDGEHTTDSR